MIDPVSDAFAVHMFLHICLPPLNSSVCNLLLSVHRPVRGTNHYSVCLVISVYSPIPTLLVDWQRDSSYVGDMTASFILNSQEDHRLQLVSCAHDVNV